MSFIRLAAKRLTDIFQPWFFIFNKMKNLDRCSLVGESSRAAGLSVSQTAADLLELSPHHNHLWFLQRTVLKRENAQ